MVGEGSWQGGIDSWYGGFLPAEVGCLLGGSCYGGELKQPNSCTVGELELTREGVVAG